MKKLLNKFITWAKDWFQFVRYDYIHVKDPNKFLTVWCGLFMIYEIYYISSGGNWGMHIPCYIIQSTFFIVEVHTYSRDKIRLKKLKAFIKEAIQAEAKNTFNTNIT